MGPTDDLKRQHKTILELVQQIEQCLAPNKLAQDADAVKETLTMLTRMLTTHLATEDSELFPMILTRHNESARRKMRVFIEEISTLAGLFKTYAAKWNSAEQIREKTGEFCEESSVILRFLRDRIQWEETEIYPLADTL